MAICMMSPYTGSFPKGSVKEGTTGADTKAVQEFLNWAIGAKLKVDGVCGAKTISAIKKFQKRYKIKSNGLFGKKSKAIAKHLIKMQPLFAALRTQYEWSKKAKYHFNTHPTVANSEKEGTCITFPSVSLQRLKLLPSGKYFYLNPKTMKIAGNGADYVKGHPEIYKYFYPDETIDQLWKEGRIKIYDVVGYGDPYYHTQVFAGFNAKGQPVFYSMGSHKKWGAAYPTYTDRKVNMIVRVKDVN